MTGGQRLSLHFGAAWLTLFIPVSSAQENAAPDCHALLMPAECARFHARMAQAEDSRARNDLATELQSLIVERERLCPCDELLASGGCWRQSDPATQISSSAGLR